MALKYRLRPHQSRLPHTPLTVEGGIILDHRWRFSYDVEGDVDSLAIPEFSAIAQCDELWRTTCFEAFIRRPGDAEYLEFNFAPSGQYAAYRFTNYRTDMQPVVISLPSIEVAVASGRLRVVASIEPPQGWHAQPIEFGLSAVIEESGGTKSYWALTHPPGEPDFHHNDCFALRLLAPSRK